MCHKLKWFLCNVCEEWEIKLDPCEISDIGEVICDHCFEEQAIAENDEFGLMLIELLNKEERENPEIKKLHAPMRRKK